MKPEDDKFAEYIQILDDLQDRMIKAGFILGHAHSEHGTAAKFTPSGQDAVAAIVALDAMLGGPLSNRQIVALWLYFRELGKTRLELG